MSTTKHTPGQSLAERITARLIKEKLLPEDRAARFSVALASGKLKTSDWRLALEALKEPKAKTSTE